jgi:tetratricopeptide (TPR) repeat protein
MIAASMFLMVAPGCGDVESNRPNHDVTTAPVVGRTNPTAAPEVAPVKVAAPSPVTVTAAAHPEGVTDSSLLGSAAARSRLIVNPAKGDRGSGAVALGSPDCDDRAGHVALLKNGNLARELIRQAMLIAARDELGLTTRDEVLGESLPATSSAPTLRLGSFMMSRNGIHLTNHAFVMRGDGDRAERLLLADLPSPYSPDGSIAKLVDKAEAMSRTEFPELLRKLGAVGKGNVVRAGAPLPAGVEDQLSQLGFPGVFSAIRTVHEAVRTEGESPERLGALARGYALLGVLSEFQWHPAHKAFKARALLYAQRYVAREPKSARALRHRAYARALVGMHRDALADLAAAATAREAGNADSSAGWVDLVEALAHQDARKLSSGRGSQAKLAALLKLLTVEFPLRSRQALEAARQVADLDPGCFRAYDTMCRVRGVSNSHTATMLGPEAFARALPEALKAMPGLPSRVHDFLSHPIGGDPGLYECFEKSGAAGDDPGEPSWGVMGHLLRETRFVQVFRRLRFMRFDWAVPVDEYWNECRPSVFGHRFYPYLEILAVPTTDPVRAHPKFFEQLTHLDLEPVEATMIHTLEQTREKNAKIGWYTAKLHIDQVARDLAAAADDSNADEKVLFGRMLLEATPDSPYAMATLIAHDKKATAPEVAAWEKKAGDSTQVLAALARLRTDHKKPQEAERYLTRYVEQQPECWAFQLLAANYKDRGDTRRWLETLERSLTVEETGLEHVQVQVQLADYYMDQGQWSKAKEYAEAAGESWAAWAMSCAQRCAEGMKDWRRAELWAQRQSDRYREQPDSLFRWYLFCVKTGRGDLQAARQFTEEALQEQGGFESLHPDYRAQYQWINGDLKAALGSFRQAYRQSPGFGPCLSIMAVADLQGDQSTVAEYRKLLLAKHRQEAPKIVRIVELLPEALKAGNSRPPDLKAVKEVLETMPPPARPSAEIWIGLFLRSHGQMAAARPFLEHCIPARTIPEWHRAFAGSALRDGRR